MAAAMGTGGSRGGATGQLPPPKRAKFGRFSSKTLCFHDFSRVAPPPNRPAGSAPGPHHDRCLQRSRNVQAFKPWLERENVDSRRKFPGISFSPTLSVTGVQSHYPCQSFPFRPAQAPLSAVPTTVTPAPLAPFARLVL